jgi:hypothetical protein
LSLSRSSLSSPFSAAYTIFGLLMLCLPHSSQAQTLPAPASAPEQLNGKTCLSIEEAVKHPNKDICVAAHIFDVVELSDGTRFLDTCSPDLPDNRCQFTLVSLREDRQQVGDLAHYRNQNVRVRGIIRATHGRMGIVISHMRQFRGGPEKFRPNPRLVRGFDAQSDRPPVRDPNLSAGGRHRSFMNSRDTESLTGRSAH